MPLIGAAKAGMQLQMMAILISVMLGWIFSIGVMFSGAEVMLETNLHVYVCYSIIISDIMMSELVSLRQISSRAPACTGHKVRC